MVTLTIDDVAREIISHAEKDYAQACDYLDVCLQRIANQPSLLNKLGLIFFFNVKDDFACRCFKFLLERYDQFADAFVNYGLSLNRLAEAEKAVEQYKRALDINPEHYIASSNLAYTLHYFGKADRPEIKQAQQDAARNISNQSKVDCAKVVFENKNKLNIGYVSSDFCNHAVGRFITGILENHDRDQFNIHVFDNKQANDDSVAQYLKSLDLQWHQIYGVSTQDVCRLIQQNNIDILIDLSGHTAGERLDVFSNRVAPIQITYLGYPNTSGLPLMDFRLGDDVADPQRNESHNTETMLRMSVPMWNYTPWAEMPDITTSPFLENGYVTFGSVNNHAKLQKPWLEVWAKSLAQLPNTRFVIKSRSLSNPKKQQDVYDLFSHYGVEKQRIKIQHRSPTKAEHWQKLSELDIAFDSFPYNGTTTSCDLLWLGVPIISRQGNSHVSRTTSSLLNGLGMQSWVAKSDHDFISLCEEKIDDLSSWRSMKAC